MRQFIMMNSKKSITNNKTEVTINIIHESEFGIKIATGILIQKNIITVTKGLNIELNPLPHERYFFNLIHKSITPPKLDNNKANGTPTTPNIFKNMIININRKQPSDRIT